jgi:hypothetical protein
MAEFELEPEPESDVDVNGGEGERDRKAVDDGDDALSTDGEYEEMV